MLVHVNRNKSIYNELSVDKQTDFIRMDANQH
jgi:hypothetical protein